MKIDYSVVIRTTGKAGEKYAGLLRSINGLEPKPREVIVVLPEGYSIPEERLGWETFYFCPKGMVIQRMTGLAKCKTKYALVCDDDVSFNADFVQKLYEPVRSGLCAFSAGPLYSFLPPKGANAVLCAVMASAAPTLFHRKGRYVSVLKSSGYSYNRNLKPGRYYETQSVAWTCFFAEVSAIREMDFQAESWLDSHGYSALDDQTMFYKAWLRGIKTVVVSDAVYEHLDARTSTRNNKGPALYAMGFNRVVFWHRFIYRQQKRILSRVWAMACFGYHTLWTFFFELLNLVRRKNTCSGLAIKFRGLRDGWRYIKSEDYRSLPEVC